MVRGKIEQEGERGALGAVVLGKLARDSLTEKVVFKLKEIRELVIDAYGGKKSGGGNGKRKSVPRWELFSRNGHGG